MLQKHSNYKNQMELHILLCSDNLLLVLLQNFLSWGGGLKMQISYFAICYAIVDIPAYFFWLPAAAFSASPQSTSHLHLHNLVILSKIWTDLRAHLLYSSFAFGTFLFKFPAFSIAKACLLTHQLPSQVGHGLRNALRQKSSKFANFSQCISVSFKGRLLASSASYFCQVPLSLYYVCMVLVIQGFGLSLCPYFGFTPYTTLSSRFLLLYFQRLPALNSVLCYSEQVKLWFSAFGTGGQGGAGKNGVGRGKPSDRKTTRVTVLTHYD